MVTQEIIDELWVALKDQCCVHPETARRIIILQREDVAEAFLQFSQDKEVTINKKTS